MRGRSRRASVCVTFAIGIPTGDKYAISEQPQENKLLPFNNKEPSLWATMFVFECGVSQ